MVGPHGVQLAPGVRSDRRWFVPADLYAGVDLIDAGGHRLVQAGRWYDNDDPASAGWFLDSLGETVAMELYDNGDIWIACKTCRDRGQQFEWEVPLVYVQEAVNQLWEGPRDTPRRARLPVVPR